jgi:adenylate cyclase
MKKVENGDLSEQLNISQKDEIGAVFFGFNQMVNGLKERERIKEIFGKFVSSDIRDEILAGNLELGGTKKEASVLFCDIRNFTALSEKYSPAQTLDLLNSFFNEMVKPVYGHKGVLDKFIGDAMLAVFGVPHYQESHAQNALDCAITMLKKLDAYNEIRKHNGEEPIKVGIGINSGELIAGNLGASERMEYTVIGDTVNLASRIQNLTKTYSYPILIAESTYERLINKGLFNIEEVGLTDIRGRSAKVKLFGVKS